jgi:xylan 1,4-beta-xylosidase
VPRAPQAPGTDVDTFTLESIVSDPTSQPAEFLSRRRVVLGGAAAAGAVLGAGILGQGRAHAAAPSTTGHALIDLTQQSSPFGHVWERAVGGDWAKQALRRDYQDQLFVCHEELGIESLRFHGIFNTSMSVYAPKATPYTSRPASFTQGDYSFFNVDQVYDALVDHGMHPYVELSSMPDALAAPRFQIFFYDFNPSAPDDYAAWGKLVGAFTKHLVDRYGIGEVRRWPFEVWNEPNLPFFSGDQQAYFKLYQYAANAIKDVDASLQVGGPATSAGQVSFGQPRSPGVQYYREFMQWATANKIPVDFGSAHGYGTDTGAGPQGAASFFQQNRADTPTGLPLYVSETNASAVIGDMRLDQSYTAASFLRTVIETAGVVDALAFWCFSDIFEEVTQAGNPFYGGFGLQTIHGIKKPSYRLLQILHGVGDQCTPVTFSGVPATVGGIAVTGRGRAVDVLLCNHALASGTEGVAGQPAQPATLTVTLHGLPTGARARIRLIDEDNANPYREWVEMGSPQYPSRRQLRDLDNASELQSRPLELKTDRSSGVGSFTLTLPAEGVAAIHIA